MASKTKKQLKTPGEGTDAQRRSADGSPSRGRPQGSANFEYQPAVQIPAACPTCKSNDLSAVPGAPAITKRIPSRYQGVDYSAVRWQRKICVCGQRVTVRELLLESR